MEMEEIFDKLQAVADRYDELNELISDPEVIADTARFMKLSKEEGSLRETVEKYNEYKQVTQTIKDDEEMLREIDDPDLTAMTK
ncbi:PCRF domain-containing protein, partial [Oliverpabstia sp. DFI.9.49]|nr:PCRF domain-containing protein [Oliverpabstia sp. DFI.9.49]